MNLRQVLDQYHAGLDPFARGDPMPVKTIYSHRDDVTLANPFGPIACGWRQVSEALDFASSQFRDGELAGHETIVEYQSPDLVTLLEIEHWTAKISGREDMTPWDPPVTNTFRCEDGDWKLVHRHADTLTTFDPNGPLRGSAG